MRTLDAIASSLSKDLLKPKYKDAKNPLEGHCYVATEALYYLLGENSGYKPKVMRIEGGTHWFLQKGTHVLDPTAGQFAYIPDYTKARGCGFLTKNPSKRATVVIERVLEELYGSGDRVQTDY